MTSSTIIRDRCIRCKARINVPADAVPCLTLAVDGRKFRGFRCDICEEHALHMNTCTSVVHVERWA